MRAAASPMRKQVHYQQRDDGSESPKTPRNNTATTAAAEARRRAAAAAVGAGMNSPGSLNVVSHGATVTPLKRAPILANFEEWMKLATDNKINAANSWNFALIDYFHDMSLLKEGDGVNFQKASCTLDGCVKIYTSRVDSVSTEAGKLLSGLADSGNMEGKKKRDRDAEEGGEDEEGDEEGDPDGEEEDGSARKKSRKKSARSHEATLAHSFASLQLKKLELEFGVDPLFKKASADFDEGGAKGLLLNHLSIDGEGRIVFDSTDDTGDAAVADASTVKAEEPERDEEQDEESERHETVMTLPGEQEQAPEMEGDAEIDLDALATKFLPDLSLLDNQDICPSMKFFKLGDPSGDLSIPFLKAPDDWKSPQKRLDEQIQSQSSQAVPKIDLNLADATGIFLDGTNAAGFDDDDNDGGLLGGFDLGDNDNVGFGEGGEAWAKDAALEPMLRVTNGTEHDSRDGGDDDDPDDRGRAGSYTLAMSKSYQADAEHAGILQYFDKAFNTKKGRATWARNMAGASGAAEYWRVAKIQMQQQQQQQQSSTSARANDALATGRRKEKVAYEVDFMEPMSEELKTLLAQPPASNAQISLPRAQWRTKGRNLLEVGEGEWVDSRMMQRLWLKPRCVIVKRGGKVKVEDGKLSKTGGSQQNEGEEKGEDPGGRKGDYDANFFNDDGFGVGDMGFDIPLPIDDDDDLADDGLGIQEDDNDSIGQVFMDAREMLSPPPGGEEYNLNPEGGQQDPSSQQQQEQKLTQDPFAPGSFGSQLVPGGGADAMRKMRRPEYVNYARVAKKVDVRRLKEELWKGMVESFEKKVTTISTVSSDPLPPPSPAPTVSASEDTSQHPLPPPPEKEMEMAEDAKKPPPPAELRFTHMISSLQTVYPESQMKDISTSYCFICLLHLANEKGLVLQGSPDDREIIVSRDQDVPDGYVGE